jgi:hypothetical protein
MTSDRPYRRTYLFTLRLWIEEIGQEQTEMRGRVQHVLSGDVRYFRTWMDLVAFLEAKLQELEDDENPKT